MIVVKDELMTVGVTSNLIQEPVYIMMPYYPIKLISKNLQNNI